MKVKHFAESDGIMLIASDQYGNGGTLRDDFGVIISYADEDGDDITQIDILQVSRFLPLGAERGYDAATDTLTLGDKPDTDYRVIDSGDFVSYRQWFDDGSQWDLVALDLRQASRHLAPAIAAMPAQPVAANSRPGMGI